MRKFITTAALILGALLGGLALPSEISAVSPSNMIMDDQAGLFSDSEREALIKRQSELAAETGWNIAVVTTDAGFGTDGYDAIEYAENYYDDSFGYSSSGLLYLIDLDYRHIVVAGEAESYFDDKRLDDILDRTEEHYFNYDDVNTVGAFYERVGHYYNRGKFIPLDLTTGLIGGLIAAAIGVIAVLSRYKFHRVTTAHIYLDRSRTNFYRRSDRFIREFTTRTKISSDTGGSSGGGHSSSGGRRHGGGGRGGRR